MKFQCKASYASRQREKAPHSFRAPGKPPRNDRHIPLFSVQQLDDSLAKARLHLLSLQSTGRLWSFGPEGTAHSLIALIESGQTEEDSFLDSANRLYEQQFENTRYPDIDNMPMALMVLLQTGGWEKKESRDQIEEEIRWILAMQNSDGGWGVFDGNNKDLCSDIFAAGHASLNPSSPVPTARCIEILAMVGHDREFSPLSRGLNFLHREQKENGPWFGRCGGNDLCGTWSVLSALSLLEEDPGQEYIQRAITWIKESQNRNGGWGEPSHSCIYPSLTRRGPSTPSQTAWALLGLLAAGEANSAAVQRGVHYLLQTRNEHGSWDEPYFSDTIFAPLVSSCSPEHSRCFPLWALGMFRRLRSGEVRVQARIRQSFIESNRSSGKKLPLSSGAGPEPRCDQESLPLFPPHL